jgi:hypothetical protein
LNTYIGEKYAVVMTKEDVGNLFNALVKKLGNHSEAARRCGLTGKATYDWKEVDYVKLRTKRKVLEACLTDDFLETIEYLLNRNNERTTDVLRTVLSTVYADAVETESKEEFENFFDKFLALKLRYRGLVRDTIEDEVSDMENLLRERSQRLGVSLREKSIGDLSAKELLDDLDMIGHFYLENPVEAESLARNNLALPEDALKSIFQTFRELCHMRDMKAAIVEAANPSLERYKYIVTNESANYLKNMEISLGERKGGVAVENITRT